MAKPFSKVWWTEERVQTFAVLLFGSFEILFSAARSYTALLSLDLVSELRQGPPWGQDDRELLLQLEAGRSGLVAVTPVAVLSIVLGMIVVVLATRALKAGNAPAIRLFLVQMALALVQEGAAWVETPDPLLPLVAIGFVLAIPPLARWDRQLKERARPSERLR